MGSSTAMRWTTSSAVNVSAFSPPPRHLCLHRSQAGNLIRVIPEIDTWRAANLMLTRHGKKVLDESTTRAEATAPLAMKVLQRDGDATLHCGYRVTHLRAESDRSRGGAGTARSWPL